MTILGSTRIKRCILYGQLFVIFTAFASLYPQIHGLFGERGLVPVAPMLECEADSFFECRLPLLRATCYIIKLSPSVGLQVLCLIGVFISALAIYQPALQKLPTFVVLYMCYRTIYEAGGVFMYYEWDAFLLESTVYVGILAWFEDGAADSVALFNIVTLLVRFTFMTGATKLLSKCPQYWNLTALNYHFESQPLPTPISWYAHHFPPVFKQLASLITHYIEIILPPFFLVPVIPVRYFVFFCQVLLTTLTMFTGNNGFLNMNVLVLLVALLETPRVPVGSFFVSMVIFGKIATDLVHRLPYQLIRDGFNAPSFVLNVSYETYQKFTVYYIDVIIVSTAFIFTIVSCYSLIKGITSQGTVRKSIHIFFVTISVLFLNIYGIVPLLRMDEGHATKTIKTSAFMSYYKTVNSFGVANSYGSYAQMTGMYGRPEIVIEGATNIEGPWKEIEFRAKPVRLYKRPQFTSPHHPRLDTQMHFAAEGTYQQNPFFLSLIYHLMENTTEVVMLTDNYPFMNRSEPMKFARAKLYMYHFSKLGETRWWERDFQEEYMPAFNRGNEALVKYLVDHRIINRKKAQFTNGPLGNYLRRWHRITRGIDALTSVLVMAVGVILIRIYEFFVPEEDLLFHDDEFEELPADEIE